MKNVLLVTDIDFWNGGAGHRVRVDGLISFISKFTSLSIAYVGGYCPLSTEVFNNRYHAELIVIDSLTINTDTGTEKLLRNASGEAFDVVIIEYLRNTYLLQYVSDEAIFILDAHDIVSDRNKNFEKHNYIDPYDVINTEAEFKLFGIYDYVITLCEPDFKRIAQVLGTEKTLLCPYAIKAQRKIIREHAIDIAFIASEYLPNVDAINHFLSHCWPGISERFAIRLNIYGNISKKISINDQNIKVRGYVENIGLVYDETDIIINPVRFGAGLKIKNVEALAYAVPLLTTSHGARGLEMAVGSSFLTADDPENFIEQLSKLVTNFRLRQRLSKNAYEFIDNNFSDANCFKSLLEVIA